MDTNTKGEIHQAGRSLMACIGPLQLHVHGTVFLVTVTELLICVPRLESEFKFF